MDLLFEICHRFNFIISRFVSTFLKHFSSLCVCFHKSIHSVPITNSIFNRIHRNMVWREFTDIETITWHTWFFLLCSNCYCYDEGLWMILIVRRVTKSDILPFLDYFVQQIDFYCLGMKSYFNVLWNYQGWTL